MDAEERGLQHWRSQLAAAPGNGTAFVGVIRSLALLNRPDEILAMVNGLGEGKEKLADWALRVAVKGLPGHSGIGLAFCASAERLGEDEQVLARWGRLKQRQSRVPEVQVGYIDLLTQQGKYTDAERAVAAALLSVGDVPAVREAAAALDEARGDWAGAARHWARVAEIQPDHPEAEARRATAEHRATEAPPLVRPDLPPPPPPLAGQDRAEIKTLLTGFESLGANCEFGLLQRSYGAEPLSLLRFAATEPPTLVTLLRTRFAGMGEPNKMRFDRPTGSLRLSHLYPTWTMHIPGQELAAQTTDTVDIEKLFSDQCRHVGFLRKKLVKDLEKQAKILIYQKSDLSDRTIADIYAASQEYGPNRLMCVRVYDEAHPPGTVEWREDRLMVAFIDRPGRAFGGARWNISAAYWVQFCRAARERWPSVKAAG